MQNINLTEKSGTLKNKNWLSHITMGKDTGDIDYILLL